MREMNNKGKLYIISAPSGGGKTSLVNALVSKLSNLKVSISHTTRKKRAMEQEGINYHFIDKEQFDQMAGKGDFLEYAEVFGNSYGTSKSWVRDTLNSGQNVILEIDWQGAQQTRKIMPEAIGIFILPPSKEILRERLESRESDSKTSISHRLSLAKEEISHSLEYDYLVENDNFVAAVTELAQVIQNPEKAQHLLIANKADAVDKVLRSF